MSIGKEFFANPHAASMYQCVYCKEVAHPPVLFCSKDHIICEECTTLFKECPLTDAQRCRVDTRPLQSNPFVERNFLELELRCTQECEWEGTVGSLKQHKEKDCPETKVGCENVDCKVIYRRKDRDSHVPDCFHTIINCSFCKADLKRGKMQDHHDTTCPSHPIPCPKGACTGITRSSVAEHLVNECPFTIVFCSWQHFGCPHSCERRNMKEHEGKSDEHLKLAMQKVNELSNLVKSSSDTLEKFKQNTHLDRDRCIVKLKHFSKNKDFTATETQKFGCAFTLWKLKLDFGHPKSPKPGFLHVSLHWEPDKAKDTDMAYCAFSICLISKLSKKSVVTVQSNNHLHFAFDHTNTISKFERVIKMSELTEENGFVIRDKLRFEVIIKRTWTQALYNAMLWGT